MDRLRVMSSARHLFNVPLRKCSKATANHRSWPVSSLTSARCVAARTFSADAGDSSSGTGRIVLESQFKPVDPVNLTLPDYIWRNVDKWEDKPMIVSHYYCTVFHLFVVIYYFVKDYIIGIFYLPLVQRRRRRRR